MFVEVEFVIVPLFKDTPAIFRLEIEALVIVAFVSVAFPPAILAVFAFKFVVERLVDVELEVVEFVARRFVVVRLEKIAVRAFSIEANKFVEVD